MVESSVQLNAEGSQVGLHLLGVPAVQGGRVEKAVRLERAIHPLQVPCQHFDHRPFGGEKDVRRPARVLGAQAIRLAEKVPLIGVDRADKPYDGDMDRRQVVSPEGMEVELVANRGTERLGGVDAHPDFHRGSLALSDIGRLGGNIALDEFDVVLELTEELEISAGAQVVL